jgi:[acyl-carrier-protein] S-malonyltransferase
MFEEANAILGFRITDLMFAGTDEDLRQTRVTQPAIFLHSVILAATLGEKFKPDMVAGHSLGEFSALVANKALSFKDGLSLVFKRALAMQKACEKEPSTMAAILGLDDTTVEEICKSIDDVVVPANYNSPGQLVISGSIKGIEIACEKMKSAGARRALPLKVGGAFHSPLMEPAPICPIYQNATAQCVTDQEKIRENLMAQLTAPVLWTQIIRNMITDGATLFTEVGPGNVLQGLIAKIGQNVTVEGV